MAYKITRPLELIGYREGKPVFNTSSHGSSHGSRTTAPAQHTRSSGSERPESSRSPATQGAQERGPFRGVLRTPDAREPLEGIFTAQFGDSRDDYVTLRIQRQKDDARFKPGKILVGYLSGPENTSDYTSFGDFDDQGRCWIWKRYKDNGRLRRAVAAVLGDQVEAGRAWARRTERCWRCRANLTTPQSLDRLVGDECYKKLQGLLS